jgi:hypothetical protein
VRFTIDGRLATSSKSTVWNSGVDAKEVNLNVAMPFVATDEWSDFWGTLTIDGNPAPVGTILAAYDPDGVYIGDFILTEAGQYGFLHAYGDDADTPSVDEGAGMGDALSFRAFLPLSTVPLTVTPTSGAPTWQGRGSRTEVNLSGGGIPGPVAPSGMTIGGPTIGEPGVGYTFTITVDPIDVTTPLTYVIDYTDRQDPPLQASLGRSIVLKNRVWSTLGPKVITVTASNEAGSVTGTHTLIITEGGVISVTGVTITGPTVGYVETPYGFTAAVQPQSATAPITYTWTPEPGSGQGTATVTYTWSVTGIQSITVTAVNAGGSAQRTHAITINAGAPPVIAPTAVSINGPAIGTTNGSYTFTITVDPVDVTTPLTYSFQYTGLADPVGPYSWGRSIALKNRTWSDPGTIVITVTASNVAGSAVGTHTIRIAEVFVTDAAGDTRTFTDTTGLETTIDIPSGVLSETTTFTYTPNVTVSHPILQGFGFIGRSFDLDTSSHIGGQITATLTYRDQDWMDAGVDPERSLRLYYWNGTAWDDVANACGPPTPTYAPDTDANVLTAPVCHLSEFAIFGETAGEGATIYLPLVLRNQ